MATKTKGVLLFGRGFFSRYIYSNQFSWSITHMKRDICKEGRSECENFSIFPVAFVLFNFSFSSVLHTCIIFSVFCLLGTMVE